MLSRPHPPLEGWPLQVADERFGFAWYCPGAFVVAQAHVEHATEEAAAVYLALEDAVLKHRSDELQTCGGLHVIHDWRSIQSYDASARRFWRQVMSERPQGYLRAATVYGLEDRPLLKMAVQGANLVAALTHGARIETTSDLRKTLRKLDVEPPAAGTPFPGHTSAPSRS